MDYDEQIYKSLKCLGTDPTLDFDSLDMRFVITSEEGKEIELIPNGAEVQVCEQNIEEYCLRVAKYYLVT